MNKNMGLKKIIGLGALIFSSANFAYGQTPTTFKGAISKTPIENVITYDNLSQELFSRPEQNIELDFYDGEYICPEYITAMNKNIKLKGVNNPMPLERIVKGDLVYPTKGATIELSTGMHIIGNADIENINFNKTMFMFHQGDVLVKNCFFNGKDFFGQNGSGTPLYIYPSDEKNVLVEGNVFANYNNPSYRQSGIMIDFDAPTILNNVKVLNNVFYNNTWCLFTRYTDNLFMGDELIHGDNAFIKSDKNIFSVYNTRQDGQRMQYNLWTNKAGDILTTDADIYSTFEMYYTDTQASSPISLQSITHPYEVIPCLTQLPRNVIYANFQYQGMEDGTETNPYNTLTEAVDNVTSGGFVIASGNSSERIRITKPVSIHAGGSNARIGK